MTDALQRLIDRAEIEDLHLLYCRVMDRRDARRILECFHEDAVIDQGPFVGSPVDFVNQMAKPAWPTRVSSLHYVTNQLVEFDGAHSARSESLVYAVMHSIDNGLNVLDCIAGRYISRLERRDGVWRIAHRTFLLEWGEKRDLNMGYPPGIERFRGGRPYPDDPIYKKWDGMGRYSERPRVKADDVQED